MKDALALLDTTNDKITATVERLQAFGVNTIKTIVRQSPTSANYDVAICQTEVAHGGLTVSMCGCSSPETSQSKKPHVLISHAALTSLEMAEKGIRGLRLSAPTPESSTSPQWSKKKHNPKLPMSDKQKEFIRLLAHQKGMEAEAVVKETVGKSLDTCSRADANKIINHLKDDPHT